MARNGMAYTRVCVDCGMVMHNVHYAKMRCPACQKEHHRIQTAKWWARKNEGVRSTKPKPAEPVKTAEDREAEFRADCRAADKLGISYGKYMLQKMQTNKKPVGAPTPTSCKG